MFDFHVHTTASDGELNPKEIIEEAKRNNLKCIAITDHDSVSNIEECIKEGQENNVKVIPGIEFSTNEKPGEMHILGYGIDIKNLELEGVINILSNSRDERNNKIIEVLKNKYGIEINLDDVKKYSKGRNLRRPHFARVLVEKGYCSDVRDAFNKYLAKPEIANLKQLTLNPKSAIEVINKAGGIAVLAHPHTLELGDEELKQKIRKLKEHGLAGVEVFHSDHEQWQEDLYLEIAKAENLLITVGSDYHGKNVKPEIELGKGKNNNLPKDRKEYYDNFIRVLELRDEKDNEKSL